VGVTGAVLAVWVIYDHPLDMPEHIVARRHDVLDDGPLATDHVLVGDTLDAVRAQLPPGLARIPRDRKDEPHIVEVWL